MRQYRVLAVLLLAGACRTAETLPATLLKPDSVRIQQDIAWLADDRLEGRATGLAGNDSAAAWLARRHALLGLRPLGDAGGYLQRFTAQHPSWVIEGCYADLLAAVLPDSTEAIFLNPGVEACVQHCRQRPWEPHKYSSPAAQDKNLELLLVWVRAYETRQD